MALHQLRTADIGDLVTLRLSGTLLARREKRGPAQPRCLALLRQHLQRSSTPRSSPPGVIPTKDTLTEACDRMRRRHGRSMTQVSPSTGSIRRAARQYSGTLTRVDTCHVAVSVHAACDHRRRAIQETTIIGTASTTATAGIHYRCRQPQAGP